MKRITVTLAKILLVGTLFFFVGKVLFDNLELIREYEWDPNLSLLMLSYILLTAGYFLDALGWHFILWALGVHQPLIQDTKIWLISHLGRFLPGYVWQFVGRIAFLSEQGISKKRGLLSIYLESASLVLSAILTALISMLLSTEEFNGLSLPLILTAMVGCVVIMHPKVLELALNILFTIFKKEKVQVEYSFRRILLIILYYIAFWFFLSFAFFLFVSSLYKVEPSLFFNVTIAFTTSWVIGFITILAPGGLGAREGSLMLFLQQALPKFIAPVIAISARVWAITGELTALMIVMVLCKKEVKSRKR